MTPETPSFEPETDPAVLLAEIGEELLAIRRSGPIHELEEAKILLEDLLALHQRMDALRLAMFETIFRVELAFHGGRLSGTSTFEAVNRILVRFTQDIGTVASHFLRYRLDSDGGFLLPLPQCLDLPAARRVHGDTSELIKLRRLLEEAHETVEALDAIGQEVPHILESEHLQRYWLEQIGYLEIESVIRWIETSLAGSDDLEEGPAGGGSETDDALGGGEYPRLQFQPGSLFLDEEGALLGRYLITPEPDSPPMLRTVVLTNLPNGTRYPWVELMPEALLARVRQQQEKLLEQLADGGIELIGFEDEDDLLTP